MWIKEAPSLTRMLAEWMTDGKPEMDPASANIARFYDQQKTPAHVAARGGEWFPKFYGIVHPGEQWATDRNVRLGPAHARHLALGAELVEIASWERPNWYEANRGLLAEYGERVLDREAEWDRRWWSPIINAEHLALRDRVGLIENPAFAVFDVGGPAALSWLQRMAVGEMDVPVGRLVYTQLLNEAGGIKADVTVMRLAAQRFRIVDAGFAGMSDRKWLADHLPADGSAHLEDATSAWSMIAVWGPRARDVLASVTDDDVSNAGFPFATCRGHRRRLPPGHGGPDQLRRRARLGDPRADGAGRPAVGPAVGCRPGQRHGGGGSRRLRDHAPPGEGLPAHGPRARARPQPRRGGPGARRRSRTPTSSGTTRTSRSAPRRPAARLCTLTVDDHASPAGVRRFMLGGEPVTAPDGRPLVDARGRRSFVTTAGSGPSVGKHLLMAYLPTEVAVVGHAARRRVRRRSLSGDRRGRRRGGAVRPAQRATASLTRAGRRPRRAASLAGRDRRGSGYGSGCTTGNARPRSTASTSSVATSLTTSPPPSPASRRRA